MQKQKSSHHYIVPWLDRPGLYKSFERLEKTIDYQFKNKPLLFQALTHSSTLRKIAKATNVTSQHAPSFERLEFLGDAVLNLMVAHYVFTGIPSDNEGELSKLRSLIVNEAQLARVAKTLKLGQYIVFGDSEISSSGQNKPRILADCMEALIGALFEDAGFDLTKDFLLKVFDFSRVDLTEIKTTWNTDYKSLLQEHLQVAKNGPPIYQTISVKGTGVDQKFVVGVFFNEEKIAQAQGSSKKTASQRAAEKAWNQLTSKSKKE